MEATAWLFVIVITRTHRTRLAEHKEVIHMHLPRNTMAKTNTSNDSRMIWVSRMIRQSHTVNSYRYGKQQGPKLLLRVLHVVPFRLDS